MPFPSIAIGGRAVSAIGKDLSEDEFREIAWKEREVLEHRRNAVRRAEFEAVAAMLKLAPQSIAKRILAPIVRKQPAAPSAANASVHRLDRKAAPK